MMSHGNCWLLCIKQKDWMLPCVCSVIDYRRYKNVVRKSVTHLLVAISYHILMSSVNCNWTDTWQHGIYMYLFNSLFTVPTVIHSPLLFLDVVDGMGTKWPLTIASLSWKGRKPWTLVSQLWHKCLVVEHSWHLSTATSHIHFWQMTSSRTAKELCSKDLKIVGRHSDQLSFNDDCRSDQFCFFGGLAFSHLTKSSCASNKISFISPLNNKMLQRLVKHLCIWMFQTTLENRHKSPGGRGALGYFLGPNLNPV